MRDLAKGRLALGVIDYEGDEQLTRELVEAATAGSGGSSSRWPPSAAWRGSTSGARAGRRSSACSSSTRSARRRSGRHPDVLAAYAARTDAEDPLSGLELGERPDPKAPEGWATVEVSGPLRRSSHSAR